LGVAADLPNLEVERRYSVKCVIDDALLNIS